jgi:hypothetical protein
LALKDSKVLVVQLGRKVRKVLLVDKDSRVLVVQLVRKVHKVLLVDKDSREPLEV